MKRTTTVAVCRTFSFVLISLAAVAACASIAGAVPLVRTELEAEPPEGRWKERCPAMETSGFDRDGEGSRFNKKRTLLIKRNVSPEAAFDSVEALQRMQKRTLAIGSQDGSVIGVSTSDGAWIMRCAGGKLSWRKPLDLAPTSVTTDAAGNVYYAGVAAGPQGAYVALGSLTPMGDKAWEARIDGPGNQSEATLEVAPGATGVVYVLGTSTETLPGQPAGAKGHRFVARYSSSGEQEWLRQSPDFGKPTREIGVREIEDGLKFVVMGDDATPSSFDVDAAGNAYVATMLPGAADSEGGKRIVPLARLVVIDAKGNKVSAVTVRVAFDDVPLDLMLNKVLVRQDGQSIYLVLGRSIVKVDRQGKQQWARTLFMAGIKPEIEGEDVAYVDMAAFTDAALQGDSLYLLSLYTYDDDKWLPWNRTLVVAVDAERGEPRWARIYGVQDGATGIQALPSGEVLVTLLDLHAHNVFRSDLTIAKLFELSGAKVDPQKPTGEPLKPPKASGPAGSIAAASTVPVTLPLPDQMAEGHLKQMCPTMTVFGRERDFDFEEKHSRVVAPGTSPKEAFNSADALRQTQAQALVIGSASYSVVGISVHDGVWLTRCVRRGSTWSRKLDVAPTSLTTDAAGNIYYAGVGAGPQGAYVEIGKFTAKGAKAWEARIDGPGHQSEAQIRVTPKGRAVYVLGVSTVALPGQPAAAKGQRFVARYGPSGKQEWLRQSADFGKPTTTTRASQREGGPRIATMSPDSTPSSLDIDASGNVYVAAGFAADASTAGDGGAVPLARVAKLDAKGQTVWTTTTAIAKGDSPHRTLARVVASKGGRAIFVAAGYFIVKLDGDGVQQWTRRLAPPAWEHPNPLMRGASKPIPRVDAALRGGRLYLVMTSFGPPWGNGTVAVVDAERGELKSARVYPVDGWASRSTIQLLPDGAIMISTAGQDLTTETDGSWTTLWRLTDMKAPRTP
ncbi:MAG: hypothetical protein JRJ24_00040 [Deltaproteobacteria bacterium]|nr:hypothetical protein [Deltaproteobacteria bacterium]